MKIKFEIVLEVKDNMLSTEKIAIDFLDAIKMIFSGMCNILWGDDWVINYTAEVEDDKKNNSVFSLN